MSLPSSVFTSSAIINSLPQVPVPLTSSASGPGSGNYQLTVSLPTVPVASMQNQTQQIQVRPRLRHHEQQSPVYCQVPVTVSNLVSSLQQPLPPAQVSFLPQVGHLKRIEEDKIQDVSNIFSRLTDHFAAGSSEHTSRQPAPSVQPGPRGRARAPGPGPLRAAPDQPRQPGAGGERGPRVRERDAHRGDGEHVRQPAPVLASQPGPAKPKPRMLSVPANR